MKCGNVAARQQQILTECTRRLRHRLSSRASTQLRAVLWAIPTSVTAVQPALDHRDRGPFLWQAYSARRKQVFRVSTLDPQDELTLLVSRQRDPSPSRSS